MSVTHKFERAWVEDEIPISEGVAVFMNVHLRGVVDMQIHTTRTATALPIGAPPVPDVEFKRPLLEWSLPATKEEQP